MNWWTWWTALRDEAHALAEVKRQRDLARDLAVMLENDLAKAEHEISELQAEVATLRMELAIVDGAIL